MITNRDEDLMFGVLPVLKQTNKRTKLVIIQNKFMDLYRLVYRGQLFINNLLIYVFVFSTQGIVVTLHETSFFSIGARTKTTY